MLRPEIQKFAEMIQQRMDTMPPQPNQPVVILNNLDNPHLDLFRAVHEDGSRERVRKNCVDMGVALCLMMQTFRGGVFDV